MQKTLESFLQHSRLGWEFRIRSAEQYGAIEVEAVMPKEGLRKPAYMFSLLKMSRFRPGMDEFVAMELEQMMAAPTIRYKTKEK